MHILSSLAQLRAFRFQNNHTHLRTGFVPTMGALHSGHLELIKAAQAKTDRVIVSIFVNPTQFAPHEDFDAYPRDNKSDIDLLQKIGVDAVYIPQADEIYPAGNTTQIRVEGLSDLLDGVVRPHFFYGVTNVVARLFAHVSPHLAAFGEKDFQQLQIIRRMTQDIGLPIEILGVPTARAKDGLALSSRNRYLTDTERKIAPILNAALLGVKKSLEQGMDALTAEKIAIENLLQAGFQKVDYVSTVNKDTLQHPNLNTSTKDLRVLGAAWLGKTRLIDNV